MFADPIYARTVLSTASTTTSLEGSGSETWSMVCISRGPTSSVYRYSISSSHYIDLLVGRQVGKRTRYTFRFTETELVTDPIDSSKNSVKTSTLFCVADIGVLGTGTNWQKIATALGFLLVKRADGDPDLNRLVAGET